MWNNLTMEYYSAIKKKNKLLVQTITWMNLKILILVIIVKHVHTMILLI